MATEARPEQVPVKQTKRAEAAAPAKAMSPFDEFDRFLERVFPWARMRPMRLDWPEMGRLGTLFEPHFPHFDWPDMARLGPMFEARSPRVDVIERDDQVLVRAELPGVEKKDLEVDVTDSMVTITARTTHEATEETGDYYRSEIASGRLVRSVHLPSEVDASKAKAQLKDGMLELSLPKLKQTNRRRVRVE